MRSITIKTNSAQTASRYCRPIIKYWV